MASSFPFPVPEQIVRLQSTTSFYRYFLSSSPWDFFHPRIMEKNKADKTIDTCTLQRKMQRDTVDMKSRFAVLFYPLFFKTALRASGFELLKTGKDLTSIFQDFVTKQWFNVNRLCGTTLAWEDYTAICFEGCHVKFKRIRHSPQHLHSHQDFQRHLKRQINFKDHETSTHS